MSPCSSPGDERLRYAAASGQPLLGKAGMQAGCARGEPEADHPGLHDGVVDVVSVRHARTVTGPTSPPLTWRSSLGRLPASPCPEQHGPGRTSARRPRPVLGRGAPGALAGHRPRAAARTGRRRVRRAARAATVAPRGGVRSDEPLRRVQAEDRPAVVARGVARAAKGLAVEGDPEAGSPASASVVAVLGAFGGSPHRGPGDAAGARASRIGAVGEVPVTVERRAPRRVDPRLDAARPATRPARRPPPSRRSTAATADRGTAARSPPDVWGSCASTTDSRVTPGQTPSAGAVYRRLWRRRRSPRRLARVPGPLAARAAPRRRTTNRVPLARAISSPWPSSPKPGDIGRRPHPGRDQHLRRRAVERAASGRSPRRGPRADALPWR